MYKKIQESNVILDLGYFNQKGLSLRIFESAMMNKKIITNNKNIEKINFYNKKNHLVFEKHINKTALKKLLTNKYCTSKDHNLREYSLRNWVNKILSS